MSYLSDIRLMIIDLRIGRVIDQMHKLTVNNKNEIINNIINDSIYKIRNINNNLHSICEQYKKNTENNELSREGELNIVKIIYTLLTLIGDESHEVSLKLSDTINTSNIIDNKQIKGLIQILERLHIRTRYSKIIELLR